MSEIAISARGLGKRYRIGQVETALMQLRRRLRKREQEYLWAVDDASFDINVGDAVAVIGRNGAGKSTLLKLLSRITEPTVGYADIYGRVASLLEVGTGFHLELTGRENVYLNGSILGMSRAEVRRKFDEIVDFSGVAQHIDTPVKWYSSGMYVRLAFAVAAHLEPEILIVDEVLAVGDAEFQKRCLGRMSEVAKQGRTVLFVSHNMQAIRRLCRTGILLERGKVAAAGPAENVIQGYLATAGRADEGHRRWDSGTPLGDALCQVRGVYLADGEGRRGASFFSSSPITVTLEFDLTEVNSSFTAGFDLATLDGVVVFRSYLTDVHEEPEKVLRPGRNAIRCTIPAALLNSGRYLVNLRISLHGTTSIVHSDDVLQFDVIADHGESLFLNAPARPGLIAPIMEWEAVDVLPESTEIDFAPERLAASS
jgi:homopolymeric O-antigen transport system ATP-binding protein